MTGILLALAGAVGGGLFWVIRRPDRDGKRPSDQRETNTESDSR